MLNADAISQFAPAEIQFEESQRCLFPARKSNQLAALALLLLTTARDVFLPPEEMQNSAGPARTASTSTEQEVEKGKNQAGRRAAESAR